MPSLTYFVAGTLPIPTFSRVVNEKVPSGFVLDVGHLWTVFLYAGAWRTTSLVQFIDAFLRVFPLERVVEIHVAGLAIHESSMAVHAKLTATRGDDPLPAWTDAHAAPIPSVLFEMLDQILSHSRLTSLKGLALEVDTKPVELIVDEFTRFSQRYATIFSLVKAGTRVSDGRVDKPVQREPVSASIRHALGEAYDQYARVVTGRAKPEGPEWNQRPACTEELETYPVRVPPVRDSPLGGRGGAMFPKLCRQLTEEDVSLRRFVPLWFRQPRTLTGTYDLFLLKIERSLEFVREAASELTGIAEREAEELWQAYNSANEPAVPAARE